MIISKAEKTSQYILEITAPIFNMNGYSGTSLSDITTATGLTKGAIYGNFENKEHLALEAFKYNVRFITDKIKFILNDIESCTAKLFALTNFFRDYYKHSLPKGGCPLLNVTVDSNHTNPELFKSAKYVVERITNSIEKIIIDGIDKGEVRKGIDPKKYASLLYSMIEGAVFSAMMMRNDKHLIYMMNHADDVIRKELQFKA
jgi:AcrR family transcriptional regulator